MGKLKVVDTIAMILVVITGLNYALSGLFRLDLVGTVLGVVPLLTTIAYILVGLAALYITGKAIKGKMA